MPVSASSESTIRLCDVATGREVQIIEEGDGSWFDALVVSPDGSLVASTSNDKMLWPWDMRNGREALKPLRHRGHVETVAFSPDSLVLASRSEDSIVRLWGVSTGQLLEMLAGQRGGC